MKDVSFCADIFFSSNDGLLLVEKKIAYTKMKMRLSWNWSLIKGTSALMAAITDYHCCFSMLCYMVEMYWTYTNSWYSLHLFTSGEIVVDSIKRFNNLHP